ncbi:Alpha-1,3-mannosyltransferase-like protein [Coemansia sp. RSA 1813]|nr:Alpha-1,3-mannosyltransferase-like protein [Coemansia sp. RSA 1646]KAJ1772447.1 Alpha-1,3-mannosyltransferase-like protein [Coemansia sp. RSA 1843]KAJ2091165.1 Alpha-1,3-mannosyltransferase-like protein [Coemansia sp. RSA 986]KAJ2213579.1 Alpha-1,3-mannosyltransferase-like protein [Coemansia sp. RSA 487]KAJ2571110.1 Alpha-1,3-mannosyltransferase-like protein [Coemansia sp. RSA 1813]
MSDKLNIAFVHPNLGIGGAERLVVDAAISLKKRGHRVVIYTMHHDLSHCFEETRDGTLEVRVVSSWLIPSSINGRFSIFCSVLRSLALAQRLGNDGETYDILFVDQLSAPIPMLKYTRAHILFYCHFPDYLSAPHNTVSRKLYRMPFDLLEEFTTGEADEILVNSRFTQDTFRKAFPYLTRIPKVLMPALNLQKYDVPVDTEDPSVSVLRTAKKLVVSINRFERKKDIGLAIDAFDLFVSRTASAIAQESNTSSGSESGPKSTCGFCLVVAGGWDPRVSENVEHLKELYAHARKLGLRARVMAPQGISAESRRLLPEDATRTPTIFDMLAGEKENSSIVDNADDKLASVDVLFLPSFTENQRTHLLSVARCVVYTPTNEHLGIVPLEAMYTKTPVIAVNSGGPRETIQNGKTGYLCEPDKEEFAVALARVLTMSDAKWQAMADTGHKRVKDEFSLDRFGEKLENVMYETASRPTSSSYVIGVLLTLFIFFTATFTIFVAYWF